MPGAEPVSDIKAPPGFTASLYSDNTLAPDIYTMTIDVEGRVLVAGRGYVRLLVDDDGDGRADRAVELIDGLKDGPMGLLTEGDSLYVVADGGLKRYRGYNGRDKLRDPPETLLAVKTAGEHEAHAVRRGPDGWLYLMCGNMAGVPRDRIDKQRSPVKDPIAGCLLRLSPDFKTMEVVADGFRNAYDFDFHTSGEPFTYDSDNERCVGLPWYEGCRFYHVVPGGNYGWRSPQLSQTWRKPPYFADVVAPVADLGRGSPTGVACYRHTQFPDHYRGGFFLADWTFGRVYFVPLKQNCSTFVGKPEVFLEATGQSGFAPTALAVHPKTGELFVSIGGRGTRGAVYRVRCDRGEAKPKPLPVAQRSLDHSPETIKTWYKDATGDDLLKGRFALELMHRWREKLGWGQPLFDAVKPNLSHTDPLIRAAAGRLAVATAIPTRDLKDPQARLSVALADATNDPDWAFETALAIFKNPKAEPGLKLQALRVIQLALGDLTTPDAVGTVWEGYTLRGTLAAEKANRFWKAVLGFVQQDTVRLPARAITNLDRELARTIAAVGPPTYTDIPWWIGLRISPESDVRDDIHFLAVFGRIPRWDGRDIATPVANGLLNLDRKAAQQKVVRDRHWPIRVEEIASTLLKMTYVRESFLAERSLGRPEHLILVKHLKLDPLVAARIFLSAAEKDPEYAWTAEVVAFIGSRPLLLPRKTQLKLWERGGLEDALLPIIARFPELEDRDKLIYGLKSLNPDVVRACARGLRQLAAPERQADVIEAIRALRRLPEDKTTLHARSAISDLLHDRTGQVFGADAKKWNEWFTKVHPELAAKLTANDGFDAVAWKKREAGIVWEKGDASAGRKTFVKATCAACHDGGGAVGPSLQGVSKRFGRDDLLTSILQPSKDVSPRYRPTHITTTDGKSFVGMIVYEAVDGIILQTGPDTTIRVTGVSIETKRTLDTSLMPTGLLDKLTDQEIADLVAYLQTQ